MNLRKVSPLAFFIIFSVVLAIIFFTTPIQLFDGVIEYEEPNRSYEVEAPLSLRSFIGMEDAEDMEYVKDFYLKPKGYVMAVIFIFGFPALLAYRIHLQRTREKK